MKTLQLILVFVIVSLAGCSSMLSQNANQKTRSSSLVDFLYPDEHSRQEHQPSIPTLNLPATVGIAFIPNQYDSGIHSNEEIALLEKVKKQFLQYDYIDRIEIIPSSYLKGGQGFTTLDQVSRLYDVDIMALVSYDQVSQTLENNAAFLYLTIVGLYVIPGNENTVQTFVDTAVFDVKSKKMLFRAPGINKVDQRSTAVGIDDTLNNQSNSSFNLAVDDMIVNLEAELGAFKSRVKEEKIANVNHKNGTSSGSVFWLLALLAGGFILKYRQHTRFFKSASNVVHR
jgi:rhombotail lipoprotein